jgi:ATP-dependent Lon protease
MSAENEKDIQEIPRSIQKQLDIVFVDDMSQVLAHALIQTDADSR